MTAGVFIGAIRLRGEKALEIIKGIIAEPVGQIYHGKVVKIMDFGALWKLSPVAGHCKDGMVHISTAG